MYKILSKTAPNKKKNNLIYFREFHFTTQWNNDLPIPLSGVMKLTYPTEWSNEMCPVMSGISVIYPTGLDK
jgi:hypothetical protein